MKFNEFNLSAELLAEIEKAGFVETSPIQEQTIPLALEGKDVIGQAQTGTGKTAAFGLPTLEKIRTEEATIKPWLSLQLVNSLSKVKRNSSALAVARSEKFAQFTVVPALKNKSRPLNLVPTSW